MKTEEMNNKGKVRSRYDSPLCDVMEMMEQSFICQSGDTEQYENTNDPDWGF